MIREIVQSKYRSSTSKCVFAIRAEAGAAVNSSNDQNR